MVSKVSDTVLESGVALEEKGRMGSQRFLPPAPLKPEGVTGSGKFFCLPFWGGSPMPLTAGTESGTEFGTESGIELGT